MTATATAEVIDLYPEVAEAPRYSCALGGAYVAALAAYGTAPILHSGAGCGIGQQFGQNYAGGQNAAGNYGNTSTPCSCLVEEHVVFGGEEKLRSLIDSTLKIVKADLYAVISGCIPSLIGDDVDAVVKEFRDKASIIHVKTAGFLGNSYTGYEHFLDAVIEQLLEPLPKEKKLVNILGLVPSQHLHWKGSLRVIKSLLERAGVKVNIVFSEKDGLGALKRIPAAELNLVFSPWVGIKAAEKLKEKFDTPFEVIPFVPVGPRDTTSFLYQVGKLLNLPKKNIDRVVKEEEWWAYRSAEYFGDILVIGLPHAFFGVIADSGTAIGLTRYGSNELGWLPELVIVSDNPPEESRDEIRRLLTEGLASVVKPKVFFETDSHKIKLILQKHSLQLLLGSSLEKFLPKGEAVFLSVSFPSYDRLIIDRTYAGYRGGVALMEDVASQYAGPL
ncbi:nitrogenase component 1 [Geobacter pickeringii]|uniref:Nitrogenase n=1 Tax=Geobacter pickeringii TaxID=345632 RepID=A0A0B5BB56_9BACT|nr:nitrogenase component 1 [Geobacter pickeringii]AJE02174.1 nitrogenase [Geobacter pickeringii]